MNNILYLNSSVRSTGSVSRQLSGEFIEKLKAAHPGAKVVTRDLAAHPLPHLSESMVGAYFTPPEQRSDEQKQLIKTSDEVVAELLAADIVVVGAPMYNFSVSSTLKAWIDHVARAGVTFKYTETGPVGLVHGKKFVIFTSRAGVYSSGPAQALDFQETYLRGVLGFLGITDVSFVSAEGLAMGDEAVNSALANGRQAMDALIAA